MFLMTQMKNSLGPLILSSVLAACGGGGGGSSPTPPPTGGGTPPPQTVTKTFTVSVTDVDASQPSTGESIAVDASAISSTGTVVVSQ